MTVHDRTRLIGQLQPFSKNPASAGFLLSAVYSCRVALCLPGLRMVFGGLLWRGALLTWLVEPGDGVPL